MSMNNVCPDYKCIMNCKVNRGYSSREHCSTCECYLGCLGCMIEHCPNPLFYSGNFFPDVTDINVKEPVESQQD